MECGVCNLYVDMYGVCNLYVDMYERFALCHMVCYVFIFEYVHQKLLQNLLGKIENLLEICKFPVLATCADGITVDVMPKRTTMLCDGYKSVNPKRKVMM